MIRVKKVNKLIVEYLRITDKQRENPHALYVNPQLSSIRRKLEIIKVVPLAERGKIIFYNFKTRKELKRG